MTVDQVLFVAIMVTAGLCPHLNLWPGWQIITVSSQLFED